MTQMTKQALADSLKRLLSKQKLDKITVKELVEDCGVNRQTFYYHFHDIYDLIDWILQEDAERILSKEDFGDWIAGLERIMEWLQENRVVVLNAYHSIRHETLSDYIKKVIRPYTEQFVRNQAAEMEQPAREEDLAFITDIITMSATGYLMEWIRKRLKQDDTQKQLERFHKAINGSIQFMLQNLSEGDSSSEWQL